MRPKLTYANVMSTLCFFLLLGGGAYAAAHLPKNSVGMKQLKKNAVTTAKIKDEAVTAAKVQAGTLTGKQIDASTLGEVPTASNAREATTLNGSPSSAFARSGQFLFGHGKINATTTETLFTVPGEFVLKTNGLGKFEPKLLVSNSSADEWDFLSKEQENIWGGVGIKPGASAEISLVAVEAGTLYAVDKPHPEKQVLIECTYEFNTSELVCTAVVSPAA